MGRPKRATKESWKVKEMRETMELILRNVVNKPPTKAFIRSSKAVARVREETNYREVLNVLKNARTNVSGAAIVKHGDTDGIVTSSIRLNIPSAVETKRNQLRKRKKELRSEFKMMDPKEILKNPSKTLVSSYHAGFPLENFEQKACTDPKCNYPLRSYIVKKSGVKDQPGFVSYETAEMCCSPACMAIPTAMKTRTMPIDLYRQRISICDDSLLRGPEQGTDPEYIPDVRSVLALNITPHPDLDPGMAMKFVEEYEAAGRPKFQIKKIGPMTSDSYLHDMFFRYEEKRREKLGLQSLVKVEKGDKSESEDEFQ